MKRFKSFLIITFILITVFLQSYYFLAAASGHGGPGRCRAGRSAAAGADAGAWRAAGAGRPNWFRL